MAKTHWKKLNNPDYLGAYALEPGEDLILTIKNAQEETYTGNGGKKETGLVVHFNEREYPPLICNATNAKTISKVSGSPYVEDWSGQKVQFYAAEVSAFGEVVEALRIRPFPPKTEEFFCSDCGQKILDQGKFKARTIAEGSRAKFGKVLCIDCANKLKEQKQAEAEATDIL